MVIFIAMAMLVYQRVDVIDAYPHSHDISDSQLL